MEEQLIEFDISSNNIPTIWDIENAEKIQFISFIEDKIEDKYSKKFDYYEQLLLSLQKEHSNQISTLVEELNYVNRVLYETKEYIKDLQNKNTEMIYIPTHIYNNPLPNYIGSNYHLIETYGMLVYNKHNTTTVYCDKFYPQLCELPNLTELKLDNFNLEGNFYEKHCIKSPNVKKLEISWVFRYIKQDIDRGIDYPYHTCKDGYEYAMKWNVLHIFPNLEHLVINLNNSVNTTPNETRVSQSIVELIEYCPCNINKITIKNDNFTGNLEPLKTYTSNNGIVCLFN
jgi:hypothetical protein